MPVQVVDQLREFEEDHLWVHENWEALLREYSEQWIVVRNQQVIANGPDLDKLLSTIPTSAESCIEFITRESLEMVL